MSMTYIDYSHSTQVNLLCSLVFDFLERWPGAVIVEINITFFYWVSGAPQTLIQSCLTFGTFSYIIEKLNKQQPALALPPATGVTGLKAGQSVLPPFTLPLPDAMDEISKFQNFLSSKFRGNWVILVEWRLVTYSGTCPCKCVYGQSEFFFSLFISWRVYVPNVVFC